MNRRSTKSKEAVLNILRENGTAMSHEMLEAETEGYNRATIYRILNRFREDGIVHRIVGMDGKQYFAVCLSCDHDRHVHRHLHFQCTSCETVECLPYEPTIALPAGYALQEFHGLVTGLCAACN